MNEVIQILQENKVSFKLNSDGIWVTPDAENIKRFTCENIRLFFNEHKDEYGHEMGRIEKINGNVVTKSIVIFKRK